MNGMSSLTCLIKVSGQENVLEMMKDSFLISHNVWMLKIHKEAPRTASEVV